MVDLLSDSLRDAVSFVAHHNDAVGREWLLIDVIAIEQRAIDRVGGWKGLEEPDEVSIYYMYVRKTSHRCLNHFGTVGIGCVLAAIDGIYAEPVGDADDGSKVAWILYAVESQRK